MITTQELRLNDAIRTRWSPRAFLTTPVEPEKLKLLLEAARWAASSYNEQPWRFLIAAKTSPQGPNPEFEKMLSVLMEFNQAWARNAPVLGISLARRMFSSSGKPNRFAMHDTGMALANLMIEATDLGLRVHGMGGFDAAKAREFYHVPEEFEVGAAFAIGYEGEAASLPESLREKELAPRTRKELSEIVFSGDFGMPAEW